MSSFATHMLNFGIAGFLHPLRFFFRRRVDTGDDGLGAVLQLNLEQSNLFSKHLDLPFSLLIQTGHLFSGPIVLCKILLRCQVDRQLCVALGIEDSVRLVT